MTSQRPAFAWSSTSNDRYHLPIFSGTPSALGPRVLLATDIVATTYTLTASQRLDWGATYSWRVVGENFWGYPTSEWRTFQVRCAADYDDGSSTGTPDGGVDTSDLLYYLVIYDAGNIAADLDDGSGTGTPDSGVDISDLLYFIARYQAGC